MEEKGEVPDGWAQLTASRRVGGTGRSWVDLVEVQSETDTWQFGRKTFLTTDPSTEYQRAIDNEVTLLKSLRHPHVIRYVDSCRPDENHMSILMEFATQGDLHQYLADRGEPLSEREAVDIMVQVARGLEYVHGRHVVHRDIKPQNIFVCGTNKVKLGDFGIARVVVDSANGATTSGAGTYAYMAPEEWLNGEKYGKPVDVWAFGVVLYEILAGQRPFPGENIVEYVQAMDEGRMRDMPQGVRDGCASLIRWCLRKNSQERPSAASLARAIRILQLDGKPTEFVPEVLTLWQWLVGHRQARDASVSRVLDVDRCELVPYDGGGVVRVRLRDSRGKLVLAESVDVHELFVHFEGPQLSQCQWKLVGDELVVQVHGLTSGDEAVLTLTFRGVPFPKSPIHINAKDSDCFHGTTIMAFGSKGSNNAHLNVPYGVCVYGRELFVSDMFNDRVLVYELHGGFVRTFGSGGSGSEQLCAPTGISVWNGEVYVCVCLRHRICVFDVEGTFVRQWGSEGDRDGQLQWPWGVCVSAGEAFVVDYNARVQVFDLEGRFLRKLGFEGSGRGQLSRGRMKGVSVYGDLVFVSNGRSCVLVFLRQGRFVCEWECPGFLGGVCAVEGGVWATVMTNPGDLILYDTHGHRLKRFDPANHAHKLLAPKGVCVFEDTVIVVDGLQKRVQMIQLENG